MIEFPCCSHQSCVRNTSVLFHRDERGDVTTADRARLLGIDKRLAINPYIQTLARQWMHCGSLSTLSTLLVKLRSRISLYDFLSPSCTFCSEADVEAIITLVDKPWVCLGTMEEHLDCLKILNDDFFVLLYHANFDDFFHFVD